jgi:hypothetical protein
MAEVEGEISWVVFFVDCESVYALVVEMDVYEKLGNLVFCLGIGWRSSWFGFSRRDGN